MEEFALIKDFAVIMAVAGAVTLLFRRFRQPAVLGYLIAGVLIGPYTLPVPPVTDVHTIRLLADLGLVLLLFGLGLEFGWRKLQRIGLSVVIIGGMEIFTMTSLGYGLGRLLGWSTLDSLFLAAALNISSSAIIVNTLKDLGRLNWFSSRIIVGILIVEDFAAVVFITILSGIVTSGATDLGDISFILFRLVIFVVASLVLGALIVPRIVRFAHQFHSREALLITALGLCFSMALISKYLGLSVAAGAFIIGCLLADSEASEQIAEVVAPVRDMFAILFFIAIGMLVNIRQFGSFAGPALAVFAVFVIGKIVSNTVGTFISGYNARTAVRVGMTNTQMGEFSLAIAKLGIEGGAVVAPLYPVISMTTVLTSIVAPYATRSAASIARFLDRRSPALLKAYITRLAEWLQVLRPNLIRNSAAARTVRHSFRTIIINLLIVMVIIGIGTLAVQFAERLAALLHIRQDIVGVMYGVVVLVLCTPPSVAIVLHMRTLVDEAATYLVSRGRAEHELRRESLRTVLRDTVLIVMTVLAIVWLIPFVTSLLSLGSLALGVPVVLLAVVAYLLLRSVRRIHGHMERNFSRVLLNDDPGPAEEDPVETDVYGRRVADLARKAKLAMKPDLPGVPQAAAGEGGKAAPPPAAKSSS